MDAASSYQQITMQFSNSRSYRLSVGAPGLVEVRVQGQWMPMAHLPLAECAGWTQERFEQYLRYREGLQGQRVHAWSTCGRSTTT